MDQFPRPAGAVCAAASRKRFDVLAQQLPVGVYELDVDGRFVYVNERWCELTGLDAEQAQRRRAGRASSTRRTSSGWSAEWRRSRDEERDFSLEFRYVRPDGSAAWIWCRAVELRDDDGELTGYLGTCSDTVVSPTVDRALEEAEERFANAFEEAPIGMALVGAGRQLHAREPRAARDRRLRRGGPARA